MKTGFKDPIDDEKDLKKVRNPWSFAQVPYDERSSCFIEAGTNHGVGKRTPVGTDKVSNRDVIPKGRINTLETSYIHKGRPNEVEVKE